MKGKKHLHWLIIVSFLFLSGCYPECYQTPYRHSFYPLSIEQTHRELQTGIANNKRLACRVRVPCAVSNALLPDIKRIYFRTQCDENRFNIDADKIPAKTFFMGLVDGTPYNMVINPNLAGDITLSLKNVTIEETMEAVRDAYGYEYRRTSYGFEVLPEELRTRIFNVNYLDVDRTGKSLTQMASTQISDRVGTYAAGNVVNNLNNLNNNVNNLRETSGSRVLTRSKVDFWNTLEVSLKTMIGTANGHSVIVNPEASVVLIRAFPRELNQVARFLDRIQCNLGRQVILEAKVLEVFLSNSYQAGIDWNAFGHPLLDEGGVSQNSDVTFQDLDLKKGFNGIFTLRVKGSFGTLIRLLQTQGNVQVLSSPRVSTVNNQKALIKVGQDEFFVTGVSTNNYISPNIALQTLPTQDVQLTPFFSGVTLDVTPQISCNGEIILHIHPAVSDVKEQQKDIVLGSSGGQPNQLSLPLALSTVRESDNIVRAHNGQVIVIGGLMRNDMKEEVAGVPVISRIPFIGTAFRRTYQKSIKSELVILLRPIITNNRVWNQDMEKTDKRFYNVQRGFHVGGYPDVFGTEGEVECLVGPPAPCPKCWKRRTGV